MFKRVLENPKSGDRQHLRPDAGVGLTETLIALVIFSTALLGIAGTAARVGAVVNSSHVRLHAAAVAQQQIEALLAEPYDEVVNGSAKEEHVDLEWTVEETSSAKTVQLVYSFDLPGGAGQETLTVAIFKE